MPALPLPSLPRRRKALHGLIIMSETPGTDKAVQRLVFDFIGKA